MDIPLNLTKVKKEIEDEYINEEEGDVSFDQVEVKNCFVYSEIKKEKDSVQDCEKEKKNGIEKVYIKEELFDDWEESAVNEDPLPVSSTIEDETSPTETTTAGEETILGFNDNFPSISEKKSKFIAMRNIGLQPVNLVVAELKSPPVDKSTSPPSNHRCDRCGKCYKNLDGLRKHRKLYCGQKPRFLCLMCPKKFYQKIHVRSHMFAVHGTVTV